MEISGCLTGTRILTTGGDTPIETLVAGELVVTKTGRILPIESIRRARFDIQYSAPTNFPVRVLRGALADSIPGRDVLLGPDQRVMVGAIAMPVWRLINGATIVRQTAADTIAYFEIVLEGEDVLLADGIPILSAGSTDVRPLYVGGITGGDLRPVEPAGAWRSSLASSAPEKDVPGSDVIREHARIMTRATALGFNQTTDPRVCLISRDTVLFPRNHDLCRYEFDVPPGIRSIRVVSRRFVPGHLNLTTMDHRELGVALSQICLQGSTFTIDVPLDDPDHAGLHAVQSRDSTIWRWTDGDATLRLPRVDLPASLVLTIPFAGAYWVPPHSAGLPAAVIKGRIILVSGEPDTPGHVYRVEYLAEAASDLDLTVTVLRVDEVMGRLSDFAHADAVVFWRTRYGPEMQNAIATARTGQAFILFDLDDLMTDPRLVRYDTIDGIRTVEHDLNAVRDHYASIYDALNAADAGCCTTDELAIHMRRKERVVYVLPNGFNAGAHRRSRLAARRRIMEGSDGLIRIGYAGGTKTHQRDFATAVPAISRILQEVPESRLVLFRHPTWGPMLDLSEYPKLERRAHQVEWRNVVPIDELPAEIARFDINLAPVEVDNLFCEAKSELKFFEAALVNVCTVASATGPFRRAIRHGETGFLAACPDEWYEHLTQLVGDPVLRHQVARAAYLDVLWTYGPERRAELLASILAQGRPGRDAARAFELELHRSAAPRPALPQLPLHTVAYATDNMKTADVTVVIPVYNYVQYIQEALESARAQAVDLLDLVVVDDCSTDDSLVVTLDWVKRRGERFNRVLVLHNTVNAGLGASRNLGIASAETTFVLPLDADNRLLPHCVPRCLSIIQSSRASFVYPHIRQFGNAVNLLSGASFSAMRLAAGNFIDAMAIIAKSAWAAVGGFSHTRTGWEDYDFWCRLVERGHWGVGAGEELAEYRVHAQSMLRTMTELPDNKPEVVRLAQANHPWLTIRQILEVEDRIAKLTAVQDLGAV